MFSTSGSDWKTDGEGDGEFKYISSSLEQVVVFWLINMNLGICSKITDAIVQLLCSDVQKMLKIHFCLYKS